MLTIVAKFVARIQTARKTRTASAALLLALITTLALSLPFASPSSWHHVAIANPGAAGIDDHGHPVLHSNSPDSATDASQVPVSPNTVSDDASSSHPVPHQWMANATSLGDGAFNFEHGELTPDDDGRDAFSFVASGGVSYIIEVEGRLDVHDDGDVHYVENYLADPSILEVVNEDGTRVMGEQDQGGYLANWARAFFTPREDATYYIAVGNGHQDPSGVGHYTISVRQDDHADDWKTNPEITILPGESITATINSDVPSDHPGLHPGHWLEWGDFTEPLWGIESLDDQDVFRFRVAEEGAYRVEITDGPDTVGIWTIWSEGGSRRFISRTGPIESLEMSYEPGTYYLAVGSRFESDGNTGTYTLTLTASDDVDAASADH